LETNQIFYLATTRNYAICNRYEYGGVKDIKDLKGRIATYNTGRAETDLMFITKVFKCHDYKTIESRIGAILSQLKDKPNGHKEMIHLRYNLLVEMADFICDNHDREIEYINAHCKRFLEETIDNDGIVPEELNIDGYMQEHMDIVFQRPGKNKVHRVDISGWDDAKIDNLIQEVINLCANEKKNIQYDFSTQKNSVALELSWKILTPYFDSYNGLTKTEWRNKLKKLWNKEKPTQLKIKGLKL
jgi:hypothetical protein